MDIAKLIAKLTDNFETGYHQSTLLARETNYDSLGRPLTCNPNYRTGYITIEGIKYTFIRKGWNVKIFNTPTTYTEVMNGKANPIAEVDLTPDYLKEAVKNSLKMKESLFKQLTSTLEEQNL